MITNPGEFNDLFIGVYDENSKKKVALDEAIKARKEETELYWKRSTYFWTLSAVALTGFFALLKNDSNEGKEHDADLLVLISCIGFFFSSTWLLANRGAKHWLNNWHHHVFLLEDDVIGPLFKTIEDDSNSSYFWPFSGKAYSVVNLNQSLCLFLTFIWLVLLLYSWGQASNTCLFIFVKFKANLHHLLCVITLVWFFLNLTFGESQKKESKTSNMKLLCYEQLSERK